MAADSVADDAVAEYGAADDCADENHADGRRLRRAQNREAVIDALLALFRDGNYQPGMAEIAARAGLSLRSVFRYFDDVDDLHRAAASRQIALVLPLLEVPVPAAAPTAEKVAAVVAARAALYEQIGPAARALRAGAHRHAPLAASWPAIARSCAASWPPFSARTRPRCCPRSTCCARSSPGSCCGTTRACP